MLKIMASFRQGGLIRGEGGSTLIELLIAMPIALLLLGASLDALGHTGQQQQDIERRTQAQDVGQNGLERMTRELRQATWVYFRSSSIVDLNVKVRATPTSSGVYRLVRWDCSGDTCIRYEGSAQTYPPLPSPTFTSSQVEIGSPSTDTKGRDGQIVGHDIFHPTHVDPTTGAITTNFVNPDFVSVRLQLAYRSKTAGVLELSDGVSLRNRTTFSG
jgi:type II secretory pathway pseudopilin PulG